MFTCHYRYETHPCGDSCMFTCHYRYETRELSGAYTWVEPETGRTTYDFDELYLLGGAHLAFMPPHLTTPVQVNVDNLLGDKTGVCSSVALLCDFTMAVFRNLIYIS